MLLHVLNVGTRFKVIPCGIEYTCFVYFVTQKDEDDDDDDDATTTVSGTTASKRPKGKKK